MPVPDVLLMHGIQRRLLQWKRPLDEPRADHWPLARDRARPWRRSSTDAERKLSAHLRGGRLNHAKFRRQYPIGFWNDQVLSNIDGVLEKIAEYFNGPSPGATRRPLPMGRGTDAPPLPGQGGQGERAIFHAGC